MQDRLDLYRNVHKGIRVMLFDLVQKSGRTDFTDAAAVAALRADVKDVFELLEAHAHKEDTFIMPLLRRVAPELAQEFDEAHEDQEARLPGLQAALERLDPASSDAARLGHRFVLQLSRIAGELLTHMSDEEMELNPALWGASTDEQLGTIEHTLIASIPPPQMARFLRWMVPNLNAGERAQFIAKLPPPVQEFVATLA